MDFEFLQAIINVNSILIGFITATLIALFTLKENELFSIIENTNGEISNINKSLSRIDSTDVENYNQWIIFLLYKNRKITSSISKEKKRDIIRREKKVFLGDDDEVYDTCNTIESDFDSFNTKYLLNQYLVSSDIDDMYYLISEISIKSNYIDESVRKAINISSSFKLIKKWLFFSLFIFTIGVIYPISFIGNSSSFSISFVFYDIISFMGSTKGIILDLMFIIYLIFILYLTKRYRLLEKDINKLLEEITELSKIKKDHYGEFI